MKLLAKIASRFNLIVLKFSCGGMPPDPPRNGVLRTLLAYPQVIFFIVLVFSGPPSKFFALLRPWNSLLFDLILAELSTWWFECVCWVTKFNLADGWLYSNWATYWGTWGVYSVTGFIGECFIWVTVLLEYIDCAFSIKALLWNSVMADSVLHFPLGKALYVD